MSRLLGGSLELAGDAADAGEFEPVVRHESSVAFGWRRFGIRQFAGVAVANPNFSTKPATRGTAGVVDGTHAATYAMWHSPQPDLRSGVNV